MRTIETNAYTLDELSEDAKQKAYQNFLETREYFWLDEWVESMQKGLKEFEFDLSDYNIDPHYPGRSNVRIKHMGNDDILELKGVRLWKYIRANGFEYIQNHYTKKLENIHDKNCPLTGYCGDVDFLEPIVKFMERPDSSTIEDLMQECIESVLNGIREDVEYQDSFEFFEQEAEANNLEFTENGDIV